MGSLTVLRWTIGLSLLVAIYQATTFYYGLEPSVDFEKAWGYAFAGMLAFWVDEDSKGRPEVYRPSFDIGLFIYLIWIIYLPYYLLRTRGRRGWLWICGLLAIAFSGTLLQLVVILVS